jgi:hypothetical protein
MSSRRGFTATSRKCSDREGRPTSRCGVRACCEARASAGFRRARNPAYIVGLRAREGSSTSPARARSSATTRSRASTCGRRFSRPSARGGSTPVAGGHACDRSERLRRAVRRAAAQPPRQAWRRRLRDLPSPPPVEPHASGFDPARTELSYAIHLDAVRKQGAIAIELKRKDRKRDGTWGTEKALALRYSEASG